MTLYSEAVDTMSIDSLLIHRRRLLRKLRADRSQPELRIAVLGSTTTNELIDLLELHLLDSGLNPVFYNSEYGRYYEDAVYDMQRLIAFQPALVYVHTCYRDVVALPQGPVSDEQHQQHLALELARYRRMWRSIDEQVGCQIIQNNFELPPVALLGNMDSTFNGAHSRFLLDMNASFATEARSNASLFIQDLLRVSSSVGLNQWFDWSRWYSYKMLYTPEGTLALARSLSAMIRSMYGGARKVLVLDLDNTLWGGVIGEEGPEKIRLGYETPEAEAYIAFQQYCLSQRQRGVLLAVCSKNDEEVALEGFSHPDSVLKPEHFAAFKANWAPKHENLLEIARELNLGVDSFVFIDDNPAERHIVRTQLPGVAVPEIGEDIANFIPIIEAGRFFESVSLSAEDFHRADLYAEKATQTASEGNFRTYDEYLESLHMSAELGPFEDVYLERIAQLTNKTNQFNLTTRRYTVAEMASFAANPNYLTIYGRLKDSFGENGLVAVVLGRKDVDTLHLDLWLMSCRVLKRGLELTVLNALVERAAAAGVVKLVGYYIPSRKNAMVADHYETLGFTFQSKQADGSTTWVLPVDPFTPRETHIRVSGKDHE